MASQNVQNDIATHLATVGFGILGTDIFVGPVRRVGNGIPVNALFVGVDGPGPDPQGVSGDPSAIRFVLIQVRNRHTVFSTGKSQAQGLYDVLALSDISGYMAIYVQGSEPVFLGQDSNDRYEWSVNLEAWYEDTGVGYGSGLYGSAAYG